VELDANFKTIGRKSFSSVENNGITLLLLQYAVMHHQKGKKNKKNVYNYCARKELNNE